MKRICGLLICILLISGCGSAKLENGKDSVAKFTEGGISADDLFEVLKTKYGSKELITLIDSELLSRKYSEDTNEKEYIKDVIASVKNQFGDDYESSIQSYYSVADEDEFKEYIRLNYRREKWQEEYAKTIVTDTEINDYYNNVTIGDIEASHILIRVNTETSEEDALAKAKDIINKLNNGEDFASLATTYSDDAATKDNGGKLGTFNYKDNFDKNFMDAAVKLNVGEYTKEPVKSSYGYHIIYKTNQLEKDTLENLKESIVETIAKEKTEDSSFMSKAMVALRNEYGLEVTDSVLKKGYEAVYPN